MIPDGGSLTEVTVEEKGVLHLKLRCHGHAAHAARPWLGSNALEHLTDALARVRKWFIDKQETEDRWYPTCSLTVLSTPNNTTNRVPAESEAVLDVRFPPPHTTGSLLNELSDILGDGVEVEVMLSADPMHLSPDPLYMEVILHLLPFRIFSRPLTTILSKKLGASSG